MNPATSVNGDKTRFKIVDLSLSAVVFVIFQLVENSTVLPAKFLTNHLMRGKTFTDKSNLAVCFEISPKHCTTVMKWQAMMT